MSGLFPTKCDVFQFEKNLVAATLFRSRLFRRRSSSFAFFILDYYFPDYYSFSSQIIIYRIIIFRIIISQICFRIAFHLSFNSELWARSHGSSISCFDKFSLYFDLHRVYLEICKIVSSRRGERSCSQHFLLLFLSSSSFSPPSSTSSTFLSTSSPFNSPRQLELHLSIRTCLTCSKITLDAKASPALSVHP